MKNRFMKCLALMTTMFSLFSATAFADSHPTPVIYSGYCSIELQKPFAEFNKFCLNEMDFNTAQNYLSVDPSGDITVLVSGFYRISIEAHSSREEAETVKMVLNEKMIEKRYGDQVMTLNVVLPLSGGDIFYFLFKGPDGEREGDSPYFHRSDEHHNRVIVHYLGPLS